MIPEQYRQYEDTVTLGCVNYGSIWNDKAASVGKVKKLIGEAADQGVNILVFPELSLSGYESNEDNTMHREFAETIPGPATEEIAALTRKLDIYVVLGMPERDAGDASTCYISCPLLGPEGFIGNYRKLHLGTPPLFRESLCFTGGDSVPVFATRYGPLGIQICADFWVFPELSRILMLKGARIIVNSTASMTMPGRPFYMTSMTAARATENMVYAASANLVGKERTLSYYGCSTIAGPSYPRFSHVYAQAEDREEIISATLSFARLHRFREAVSLDKLRRSDVISNEFNQLDTSRN